MKKLVCILVLGLSLSCMLMDAKRVNVSELASVIREYRFKDGFEALSVGRLGLSFARMAMYASDTDSDEMAALSMVKGLKKIIMVDFEECGPKVRNDFISDIRPFFNGAELLMEAHDGDDDMKIYCNLSDRDDIITDVIVFSESGMLVVLSGTIPVDSIGQLFNGD